MKIKKHILSILLAISMLFCSLPVFVQAEENFQLEAPTIEITTDKSTYGAYETAVVTVKVYPTDGCPIENVNVEASLNNQLCSFANNQLSAETKVLQPEGIEYSFNVVVSKKASGLNIFQKFILFFKRLFTKTITVTGNTFEDGRDSTSAEQEIKFGSAKGLISVNVWYDGTVENVDSDKDGLIDYLERVYGTNPNLVDTDSDGLSDYDEFATVGTDPTLSDSNGNGINDYSDDNDGDGLSNGYELTLGTSANSDDTDCDGLKDNEEVNNYKTSPVKEDTDGDGATDGWEVENGFNPKSKNSSFDVTVDCINDSITASVKVSTNGQTAESITIEPVKNNALINETIPGYLGSAFEFNAEGDLGIAKISFSFDKSLLNKKDFNPVIYCLNEENQTLFEYETIINDNIATAQSTHFSKYILLDKSDYSKYEEQLNNIDFKKDSPDSNSDGISDYITQLICNGTIRTGTGALIFDDYTYEQIQANADIDGDGLLNGEEVIINQELKLPENLTEYNGHYYKLYNVGYVWDDAESYCESLGGHLATITSSAEQSIVSSLLSEGNRNSYWLGARKVNGNYIWINGEVWSYSNWAPGQPDNNGNSGYEDCLMMYNARNPKNPSAVGQWNDLNHYAICGNEPFFGINNFGFICEWDNSDANFSIILNSSPAKKDTDDDGFFDNLDPTPNIADVFNSITDYKKYYFDDEITISIFARQPIWNSRACYAFEKEGSRGFNPYYTTGESGHSFLGIDYKDESMYYFGYYGNAGEASSGQPEIALFKKKISGFVRGELYNDKNDTWNNESDGIPVFTIGKTFVISEEQLNKIIEYRDNHKEDKYKIDSNNCTTFAVKALKYANIDVKIYEHNWTRDGLSLEWLVNNNYYGYSPADACQDIKENYDECIACRVYTLNDGSEVVAYEVLNK